MSIHQQILADAKAAMMAKEETKSLVLKSVKAAFMNELISKSDSKKTELTDDEALSIIRKLVKQRKDSIEQFEKGGRQDLASNEKAEVAVLDVYLPAMMAEDEVKKVVAAKKKELGIDDKTKMGILMAAVMKDLKGRADGATVKLVVEKMF